MKNIWKLHFSNDFLYHKSYSCLLSMAAWAVASLLIDFISLIKIKIELGKNRHGSLSKFAISNPTIMGVSKLIVTFLEKGKTGVCPNCGHGRSSKSRCRCKRFVQPILCFIRTARHYNQLVAWTRISLGSLVWYNHNSNLSAHFHEHGQKITSVQK